MKFFDFRYLVHCQVLINVYRTRLGDSRGVGAGVFGLRGLGAGVSMPVMSVNIP